MGDGHSIPFPNDDGTYTCINCETVRRVCIVCGVNVGIERQGNGSPHVCDPCFTRMRICDRCGNLLDRNRFAAQRSTCYACQESQRQLVKSSSCKVFHKPIGKGPLFLGIELETEVPERYGYETVAARINDLVGDFCIMKYDGSLVNGIEIVSCPCTFDVHKTIWDKFFNNIPKGLVSAGTGRCGMHIHITKSALANAQLGRMLVFVNSPHNSSLICAVAGRSSSYATRSAKKIEDWSRAWEKYCALNNYNGITCELRIFRGTLNYKMFKKNIEFTHAMIQFCAKDLPEATVAKPADFLAFVAEHAEEYFNLHQFLVRKNFIPKPAESFVVEPEEIEV